MPMAAVTKAGYIKDIHGGDQFYLYADKLQNRQRERHPQKNANILQQNQLLRHTA